MKYRKKPIVIDAYQWQGQPDRYWPEWLRCDPEDRVEVVGSALVIYTLEGKMLCELNDYVIRGVKGELYPCKPDIFEMTYEEVEE